LRPWERVITLREDFTIDAKLDEVLVLIDGAISWLIANHDYAVDQLVLQFSNLGVTEIIVSCSTALKRLRNQEVEVGIVSLTTSVSKLSSPTIFYHI